MPADVGLLRKLTALFGDAFADADTYETEPPSEASINGLLAKEHVVALVHWRARRFSAGSSLTNSTSSRGHAATVYL